MGTRFYLPLLAAIAFAASAIQSFGAVYYVDSARPDDTGNGLSWATAKKTLQAGINAAAATATAEHPNEVWVKEGTYKPNDADPTNLDRNQYFQLKNDVSVYGGFAGAETERSQRNAAGNKTILSGDFNGDDVITGGGQTLNITNNTENAYHVFHHGPSPTLDSTARLDGFTVTGGSGSDGGGMYNSASSPTLSSCVFSANSSSSGAGIYNLYYSSPTITSCVFLHNLAIHSGGGMYNDQNSAPVLTSCEFTENSGGQRGGGVYNDDDCPAIFNACKFTGNWALFTGGGMQNRASVSVINCTLSNNSTRDEGGGILNYLATVTITGCTLSNNMTDAFGVGGAICNHSSSSTITNSTIFSNSAESGGGICNFYSSSPTIINCTIFGNTASREGGGVYDTASSPTFINCTIAGNTATEFYGGISTESSATIQNCIFWQNVAPLDPQINTFDPPTVSNSVVQGGYLTGGSITTGNPMLQPLANNGGPVWTMALGTGSSAIDIGDGASAPTTDARGIARPQASGVDIGAYEKGSSYTITANTSGNGLVRLGASGTPAASINETVDLLCSSSPIYAMANTGYQFSQWNDGNTDNPRTLTDVTANVTITAQFVSTNVPPVAMASTADSPTTVGQTVTITASGSNDPDNGPVSPLTYSWSYMSGPVPQPGPTLTDLGSWFSASFVPNTAGAYTFRLTVDDGQATDTEDVEIIVGASAHTVTANAGANGQVKIGIGGILAASVDEAVVDGTDSSEFYAVADSGYQFSQWSDGNTNNPRTFSSVISDITVTAEFTQTPFGGGGGGCTVGTTTTGILPVFLVLLMIVGTWCWRYSRGCVSP